MLIVLGNYVLLALYLLMKLGGANCQVCIMLPTDQSQARLALRGPIGAWVRFLFSALKPLSWVRFGYILMETCPQG